MTYPTFVPGLMPPSTEAYLSYCAFLIAIWIVVGIVMYRRRRP